jgi:hypothetical protein
LLEDLGKALSHEAPLRERLCLLSTRFGEMTPTERDVIRLVVREALASSERRRRLIERFRRGHLAMLIQAIGEGFARGEISPGHHPIVLMMATFALVGAPHMMRRLGGRATPFRDAPEGRALATALVDILFDGIAPASSPRTTATTTEP